MCIYVLIALNYIILIVNNSIILVARIGQSGREWVKQVNLNNNKIYNSRCT